MSRSKPVTLELYKIGWEKSERTKDYSSDDIRYKNEVIFVSQKRETEECSKREENKWANTSETSFIQIHIKNRK